MFKKILITLRDCRIINYYKTFNSLVVVFGLPCRKFCHLPRRESVGKIVAAVYDKIS